jgi:hypothetical protein
VLQFGKRERPVGSENAAEIVDLAEVVIEVAEEVDEELAPGEFEAIALFAGGGAELGIRGIGKEGNDGLVEIFEANDEFGFRDAGVAEFAIALAGVGDVAELAANELAEIAFEVEGEIRDGVGDAGSCGEEEVFGTGLDFLREAVEIAGQEAGEFLGKGHKTITAGRGRLGEKCHR